MSDHVQTPTYEETLPPVPVEVSLPPEPEVAAPPPPPLPPPQLRVEPAWLRLAYAFEFLLALLVGVVVWTQIGGQGHLDLMPWHIKLACISLLAWCSVRLTAAIVEQPKGWNRSTRIWLACVLLVSLAMGGITYYVHLHEASDEADTDETSTTSVRNANRPQLHRDS